MLEFELVLPAYKEGKTLPTLIARVIETAKSYGYSPDRFQLIIVQNGSSDGSESVLEELKKGPMGQWFRVVSIPVNMGYGYGLWQGLQTTTAPYLGWSHADMQCHPADAFQGLNLVRRADNPAILVKGERQGRNWKDRLVSRTFESLSFCLLGLKIYEINAQPKVFPRHLLNSIKNPPKTFAFDLYVLYQAAKHKFTIKAIQVDFPPRIHGASKWAATFLSRYKSILGMIRYIWSLARHEGRI